MGTPASSPIASPGSIASWWPAMIPPRATSVPRTRMTYSCESSATSSRIRTGGMTMPISEAIWRRIVPTRASSVPPDCWSTSGTRPKPIASSSGSSASASSAASRGAVCSAPGGGASCCWSFSAASRSALVGTLRSAQPMAKNVPPISRNGTLGSPGMSAKAMITQPATSGALRCSKIWSPMSLPRSLSDAERVTMMPVAIEISSAGIWARQAVADRQQRELVHGLAERDALLDDADDDAADEVDQRDHDAGDGVALDELRGAVHRAVEVGLLGDLGAALARLLVGDLARVEVGVDRHLLARHRVEGEARGDLGHAPGAVRDDDELDDDEDQEDDQADDDVAADDEVAERGHDVPGVAVQQDQARDGDVDREAEERREQQEGRERGEVERARHVERRDDDHQRRGDVERDRQVQQERRQRHDHHHDDQHHGARGEEVGVATDLLHRPVHAAALRPAVR